MRKDGSKTILTCTANANPSDIKYKWTVDESEQNNIRVSKDGSILEIEGNSETRVYNCTAENEVDVSEPCMARVPGKYFRDTSRTFVPENEISSLYCLQTALSDRVIKSVRCSFRYNSTLLYFFI